VLNSKSEFCVALPLPAELLCYVVALHCCPDILPVRFMPNRLDCYLLSNYTRGSRTGRSGRRWKRNLPYRPPSDACMIDLPPVDLRSMSRLAGMLTRQTTLPTLR
jgi:hypothetical protein